MFESYLGSQIFKSRLDPPFSFSFVWLSGFERHSCSNGSSSVIRNPPSFQVASLRIMVRSLRCSSSFDLLLDLPLQRPFNLAREPVDDGMHLWRCKQQPRRLKPVLDSATRCILRAPEQHDPSRRFLTTRQRPIGCPRWPQVFLVWKGYEWSGHRDRQVPFGRHRGSYHRSIEERATVRRNLIC